MKLNKIALAVLATAASAAYAGVTVTPLAGYNYTGEARDEQREVFRTGRQVNDTNPANVAQPLNGGVAQESGLYTGVALGIELTPSTQFQVEYGVSDTDAQASDYSASISPANVFDAERESIVGNFLIGTEQFTGYTNSKFKPYVLVGAGQVKTEIKNQQSYTADASNGRVTANQNVAAGTLVSESKDTIGNLGLGARYLINDALALRGEARAVHNFDNNWWEGQALAGLEVTLGGRLAPTVPVAPVVEPVVEQVAIIEETAVIDSDGDGVADHLDACPGTPAGVVVDARGCPVQINQEQEVRIPLRVFFDYDKSNIKPQYREEIAKAAQFMQEAPNTTAIIEGHASKDSKRSKAKYNQRLSEARANAVKSVLSNEFGVDASRLSAVGYGFNNPIGDNATEEGRVMNRRVDAIIQGTKTVTVTQTQ